MTFPLRLIDRHFGTLRGAVRLGLSYAQLWSGRAAERPPAPDEVRRLVFACQGNICRSAFAEAVARKEGLRAISIGLSTDTGKPAHGPAQQAALAHGYDLSAHRTTRAQDYVPQPGDLLLAMEIRQMHRLGADPCLAYQPRLLLGRWAGTPHLHDPYTLSDAYFLHCFSRIARAVKALARDFPGARAA